MMSMLFSISGPVIRGKQLGRKLGYPTANIKPANESNYHPYTGVYAARIDIGPDHYFGMANIGFRPTLSESSFTIEVNIFDFSKDIYDRTITIHFLQRTRDELKFNSLDELVGQMEQDERETRTILSSFLKADSNSQ